MNFKEAYEAQYRIGTLLFGSVNRAGVLLCIWHKDGTVFINRIAGKIAGGR